VKLPDSPEDRRVRNEALARIGTRFGIAAGLTLVVGLFAHALDGTLTDPQVGITRCLAHGLAAVGMAADDASSLRPFIGPPLIEGFAAMGVPAARIDEAIAAYRERFTAVGMFENALIDCVPELLAALLELEVRLAVATSKPEPFAKTILEHFGIADSFEVIAGATLDNRRRHKEDVIAHAIDALAHPPASAIVMIGDREHDVFGARAHGLASIGVLWGYGGRGELTDARADHIVDSVAGLATLLGCDARAVERAS
jgi:phosphoglycolate phosphatase